MLAGGIEDGGDDADHFPVAVDQRAAGIAGIGRGVELDQVGQMARLAVLATLFDVGVNEFALQARRPRPAETDGPSPKGKPTATTGSPGLSPPVDAKVAGFKSSGAVLARITARSFSGWMLTTLASDLLPSQNVTTQRSVERMTCRLVRMSPLAVITTPLPMESGLSFWSSGVRGGNTC